MSMTDPIADMLTRIRNGSTARHSTVEIPASRMKMEIARLMTEQGSARRSSRRPRVW
jgi:small subunit ribosomal protein S8